MAGLVDFLGKKIKVKTLSHDGKYEIIAGTLKNFHPQFYQIFIEDYATYSVKESNPSKKDRVFN